MAKIKKNIDGPEKAIYFGLLYLCWSERNNYES